MSKEERIANVRKKMIECRKELESLKGDISSSELQKVKSSINSSISFLNRASKQLTEIAPLKGQMSLFDYMKEDRGFDLNKESLEDVDYFEL